VSLGDGAGLRAAVGVTDGVPTARSTLRADWACFFVWRATTRDRSIRRLIDRICQEASGSPAADAEDDRVSSALTG
jgi:hypothetical protein